MRIPRIHLPVPLVVGMSVSLDGNACHHVVQVLRLKPGAPLILFNGMGGEFYAVLERGERHNAVARVEGFACREVESPLEIILVQGISKGGRMDYTLQKAVELGVIAIQPIWTERSVVNLQGERLAKRLQHWHAIVVGACEQSGRNRLPPVLEPQEFRHWLSGYHKAGPALLLNPWAERRLAGITAPMGPVTLVIGPEGGLSPEETGMAEAAGFTSVRLGPRILRTETAGLAVLAALQALWGDLG